MEIENTAFGTITMDGKTYEHDVVVRLSGEVVKRNKKLSKKYYGTSHILSKDEAKFVFEKGCEQLIVGSGQIGNVRLSPEAEAYFAKKNCKVLLKPTPEAIHVFNRSNGTEDWAFSRDLLKWTGAEMAALGSFKFVVRRPRSLQLLSWADISYVIFKEEARAQSVELRRRRRRRAGLTILNSEWIDLDEDAPDDCRRLLGS